MRPTFSVFPPATMPKKPKLRWLDDKVIFPALLIAVVLIGIPLMMLIEICNGPASPDPETPPRR